MDNNELENINEQDINDEVIDNDTLRVNIEYSINA